MLPLLSGTRPTVTGAVLISEQLNLLEDAVLVYAKLFPLEAN